MGRLLVLLPCLGREREGRGTRERDERARGTRERDERARGTRERDERGGGTKGSREGVGAAAGGAAARHSGGARGARGMEDGATWTAAQRLQLQELAQQESSWAAHRGRAAGAGALSRGVPPRVRSAAHPHRRELAARLWRRAARPSRASGYPQLRPSRRRAAPACPPRRTAAAAAPGQPGGAGGARGDRCPTERVQAASCGSGTRAHLTRRVPAPGCPRLSAAAAAAAADRGQPGGAADGCSAAAAGPPAPRRASTVSSARI